MLQTGYTHTFLYFSHLSVSNGGFINLQKDRYALIKPHILWTFFSPQLLFQFSGGVK